MKEHLKIYSQDGTALLERDLEGEPGPLLLLDGERPRCVQAASDGDKVLGALVRDEDGWTLASSRPGEPVSSGPKSGDDMHLAPGVACALGGFVFRLERESVSAGRTLVWRAGGSEIVSDALVSGRNVLGSRPGSETVEVNPAVLGDALCEMFITREGLDVVGTGENALRLSVPKNALFSVGPVQAMVMDAAEAAKAVKSGNPFSWPTRGLRKALLAGVVLAAFVGLVALWLNREVGQVRRAIAANVGAREEPFSQEGVGAISTADEDVMVYELNFFRSLPLVLTARRSNVTADLIRRGERLPPRASVSADIKFLRDVDAVQLAIQKGDWAGLKKTLDGIDRMMFTICDAESFLGDAHELLRFITEFLPQKMENITKREALDFNKTEHDLEAQFDRISKNLFLPEDVFRRERDNVMLRWAALKQYIPARDRYLSDRDDTGEALLAGWQGFVEAFDPDDPTFKSMVESERETIRKTLAERAKTAKAASLVVLCELGENLGVDAETLADWTSRAKIERQQLDRRYRELYSDYRLRTAVSPASPEARAILDKMIGLGLVENHFHQWALREKERTARK